MNANIQVLQQEYNISDSMLSARLIKALESGSSRYPIYRHLRVAAEGSLESILDTFALQLGWHANRPSDERLLLDGPDIFISVSGGTNKHYCFCHLEIWAQSIEAAESAKQSVFALLGERRITAPMFTLKWMSLDSKGTLSEASIQEIANDVLLDEAYPEVEGGVSAFISDYLDSDEAVLVLYGPPGTGKTRLIRSILGEMSRRKGVNARAIYCTDQKSMESDQIFIEFIQGNNEAFVVEDADHLLRSRSDGNDELFRFLTIADGVAKAQGRKIIFSSNLPHIREMDDALIRPGRCFARVHVRNLTKAEAQVVAHRICKSLNKDEAQATRLLDATAATTFTLAQVYKAVKSAHNNFVNLARQSRSRNSEHAAKWMSCSVGRG